MQGADTYTPMYRYRSLYRPAYYLFIGVSLVKKGDDNLCAEVRGLMLHGRQIFTGKELES